MKASGKNKSGNKRRIDKKRILGIIGSLALVTLGSVIYAVAIALLLDPNKLAPGGVSGIAILLSALIPIPTGVVILILNVPLIILGVWKLGRKFMIYTAYSTVLSSLLIDVFLEAGQYFSEHYSIPFPLTSDNMLASLAGGALLGIGIGIIMHAGGSSGGSDIVIRICRIKYKHIKTGMFYMISDSVIIFISAFVFKNVNTALYAGIALITSSVILDMVLYGRDQTKLLIVISDKHDIIAKRLMDELETGITYLDGSGGYTSDAKKVLMCAIKKHHFTKAREIIRDEDKNSFMIVTSASEIFGEGYKAHFSEDL